MFKTNLWYEARHCTGWNKHLLERIRVLKTKSSGSKRMWCLKANFNSFDQLSACPALMNIMYKQEFCISIRCLPIINWKSLHVVCHRSRLNCPLNKPKKGIFLKKSTSEIRTPYNFSNLITCKH